MVKFPMKFEVNAQASAGIHDLWECGADHLQPIQAAIPIEFMGPGGGYSPEDLFALSVLNCLIATFKVYCEKSKVLFEKIEAKAELTVDKQPTQPSFSMTHIDLFLHVSGASNADQAKKMLDSAVRDCAVSNSIKTGKTFHLTVN